MAQEFIVALIGLAVAIFGGQGFWTWAIHRREDKTQETQLLLGIGFTKIIERCEYYIKRGWISADEYHELYQYLFKPYRELGGNGTAERLMKLVENLPSKEGEKNEQV